MPVPWDEKVVQTPIIFLFFFKIYHLNHDFSFNTFSTRWALSKWLRLTFFPAYFRLSPLQKHVRKVVVGFRKKSCVSTGVRKQGNSCVSPTAMI